MNLNDKALLDILDYLDFDGLYNIFQVNQRFPRLIASHKLHKKVIPLVANKKGEFDPVVLKMLPYAIELDIRLDNLPTQVIEEIVSRYGDGQLRFC